MDSQTDPPTRTDEAAPALAVVRDLYALAGFYIANPEHPRPSYVQVGHYVDDSLVVDRVARAHGVVPYLDDTQCHHDLPRTSVRITLLVSTHKDQERPL